jgi:hypothetical protein
VCKILLDISKCPFNVNSDLGHGSIKSQFFGCSGGTLESYLQMWQQNVSSVSIEIVLLLDMTKGDRSMSSILDSLYKNVSCRRPYTGPSKCRANPSGSEMAWN